MLVGQMTQLLFIDETPCTSQFFPGKQSLRPLKGTLYHPGGIVAKKRETSFQPYKDKEDSP
jgi:hypothetical protein